MSSLRRRSKYDLMKDKSPKINAPGIGRVYELTPASRIAGKHSEAKPDRQSSSLGNVDLHERRSRNIPNNSTVVDLMQSIGVSNVRNAEMANDVSESSSKIALDHVDARKGLTPVVVKAATGQFRTALKVTAGMATHDIAEAYWKLHGSGISIVKDKQEQDLEFAALKARLTSMTRRVTRLEGEKTGFLAEHSRLCEKVELLAEELKYERRGRERAARMAVTRQDPSISDEADRIKLEHDNEVLKRHNCDLSARIRELEKELDDAVTYLEQALVRESEFTRDLFERIHVPALSRASEDVETAPSDPTNQLTLIETSSSEQNSDLIPDLQDKASPFAEVVVTPEPSGSVGDHAGTIPMMRPVSEDNDGNQRNQNLNLIEEISVDLPEVVTAATGENSSHLPVLIRSQHLIQGSGKSEQITMNPEHSTAIALPFQKLEVSISRNKTNDQIPRGTQSPTPSVKVPKFHTGDALLMRQPAFEQDSVIHVIPRRVQLSVSGSSATSSDSWSIFSSPGHHVRRDPWPSDKSPPSHAPRYLSSRRGRTAKTSSASSGSSEATSLPSTSLSVRSPASTDSRLHIDSPNDRDGASSDSNLILELQPLNLHPDHRISTDATGRDTCEVATISDSQGIAYSSGTSLSQSSLSSSAPSDVLNSFSSSLAHSSDTQIAMMNKQQDSSSMVIYSPSSPTSAESSTRQSESKSPDLQHASVIAPSAVAPSSDQQTGSGSLTTTLCDPIADASSPETISSLGSANETASLPSFPSRVSEDISPKTIPRGFIEIIEEALPVADEHTTLSLEIIMPVSLRSRIPISVSRRKKILQDRARSVSSHTSPLIRDITDFIEMRTTSTDRRMRRAQGAEGSAVPERMINQDRPRSPLQARREMHIDNTVALHDINESHTEPREGKRQGQVRRFSQNDLSYAVHTKRPGQCSTEDLAVEASHSLTATNHHEISRDPGLQVTGVTDSRDRGLRRRRSSTLPNVIISGPLEPESPISDSLPELAPRDSIPDDGPALTQSVSPQGSEQPAAAPSPPVTRPVTAATSRPLATVQSSPELYSAPFIDDSKDASLKASTAITAHYNVDWWRILHVVWYVMMLYLLASTMKAHYDWHHANTSSMVRRTVTGWQRNGLRWNSGVEYWAAKSMAKYLGTKSIHQLV